MCAPAVNVAEAGRSIGWLTSRLWRDPIYHCSLLDYAPEGHSPAKRNPHDVR